LFITAKQKTTLARLTDDELLNTHNLCTELDKKNLISIRVNYALLTKDNQ